MKKMYYLCILFCLLMALPVAASEVKVAFADLALEGTNLVEMSPINLNDDIQLVFEQGGAAAAPSYRTSSGQVTLTMNAVMKVIGRTDEINITRISLTSSKASNTFSAGAASCVPEGTFTIDKTAYTSTWEDATGANYVQITSTMGAPVFTALSVTYTGGKGGSEGPDNPDIPDDPDPDKGDENTFATSFDTPEEFSALTVINTDDRTYTWRYEKSDKYASIRNDFATTASCPKDDYLVTPPMELKAGYNYRISFTTWCGNPEYPERVGAYIGKEATKDGLSTNVIAETVVNNTSPKALSGVFTVETDGTYYAAIHASSDAGMFMLYVDDLEISRAVAPAAPSEVTDLNVVPDASGALEVAIGFSAPDKSMDGSSLSEPLSIVIKRDGTEISTLQTTPGQHLSATDKEVEAGLHTYTVTVVSAEGKSFDTKSTVWVGVALPSNPTTLSVEETAPGKLKFHWEAVTTNVYGHEISPSQVTYTISCGLKTLGSGLTGTETEIEYLTADEPQEITYFTIKAVTTAGESAKSASTPVVAVGTPYTMPFAENFPNAMLTEGQTAEIIADETSTYSRWAIYEQLILDGIKPVTADGGMMALISDMAGARSVFRTGKIHIDADASNPYLTFFYYALPGAADSFEVAVDGNEVAAMTVNAEERGWKEALVPLAAYKGKDIRISLTGICANPDNKICIDNISVNNELSDDISVTRARIPYEMHQGVAHKSTIRVSNLGVNPSGEYTLLLFENGNEIGKADGSGLMRGQTKEYTFDIVPSIAAGKTALYTVQLNVAKDENESNNTVEVTTVIADNTLPAPTGLAANAADGQFRLAWNAVDMTSLPDREITESFEAYDEFTVDCAGEWSFIDGDGCSVLGIADGYHAYPNMNAPMAYMVFNNHDEFFPQIGTVSFAPYHGGQCMMSASIDVINSTDRNNDDWLISPKLSGKAQTISFYARSSGRVFLENFQVLYSTTDKLASSFTLIDSYEKVSPEWTRYETELPEGAKYFAIRNVSYDAYMFFVDNVTFSAAPVETELVGYDVYAADDSDDAEWRKLNDEPLKTTDIVTSGVAVGERFRVHAVYANGAESVSDTCVIQTSGIEDTIDNSSAEKTEYYDLRGIRLSGKPTVSGLYIEHSGNKSRTTLIK